MKFIRNLLIIFVCFSCISLSLRAFFSYHQSKEFVSLIKNKKGGKFFVGSSLGCAALNDSILNDWSNFSIGGINFVHIYGCLNTAMPYIDKIDTVVIALGTHQTEYEKFYSAESMKYNTSFNEYDFFTCFHTELWKRIILPSDYLIKTLYYNNLWGLIHYNSPQNKKFGFGVNYNCCLQESIAKLDSLGFKPEKYTYDYLDKTMTTQFFFIRKTIDLCLKNNKVCVLINLPLYHFERWFNKMAYIDFLDTLDGKNKILIADYEDYPLPDSCYNDVIHLNKYGSDILCNDIKENGLRLERLPEFIQSQRASKRRGGNNYKKLNVNSQF